MGTVNAKRRTSSPVVRGGRRPGGPGGNARGAMEMDELMEKVEAALDFKTPHYAVAKELGIPLQTLRDYIRRIMDRRALEPQPDRTKLRDGQLRMVDRIVRSAYGARKYRDALEGVRIQAKLTGTEMPTAVEIGGAGGAPIKISTEPEAVAALKRMVKEPT